jgi:hypothetical protein
VLIAAGGTLAVVALAVGGYALRPQRPGNGIGSGAGGGAADLDAAR